MMDGVWDYLNDQSILVEGDKMTNFVRVHMSALVTESSYCGVEYLHRRSKPLLPIPFVRGGT